MADVVQTEIVSHRAAGGTHPENTLAGIRASLKSAAQRSIDVAERNLDNPLAIRLLKALFLAPRRSSSPTKEPSPKGTFTSVRTMVPLCGDVLMQWQSRCLKCTASRETAQTCRRCRPACPEEIFL